MNRNCHARSRQNSRNLAIKAISQPRNYYQPARPNDRRKTASHTWRVNRLPRCGRSEIRVAWADYPFGERLKIIVYL